MIDVVRSQSSARKPVQQIILFVGRMVRADHANRLPALHIADRRKFLPDQIKRFFPSRGRELPILANQGTRQPFFMVRKVKRITPLDAQKVSVGPALIAIIAGLFLTPRAFWPSF